MAHEFEGKTIFITGAAKGQGRAVALAFAAEGANIIAFDLGERIEYPAYNRSSNEDLEKLKSEVEAEGGKILIYAGDVRITDLGVATVRARFKYNLPDGWDGKNIYVVFLDKNGNLRAIPAAYNAVTGELAFDSNLVGEFVVVTFNYKGELYSKNFYRELEKLDAVKHLINLHSGKAG